MLRNSFRIRDLVASKFRKAKAHRRRSSRHVAEVLEDRKLLTTILFQNDFNAPIRWHSPADVSDANTNGPNYTYGTSFGGTGSVDTIAINGPDGTYSDPSGIGGTYFLGLLEGPTTGGYGGRETITATFSHDGASYLNTGFDLSPSSLSWYNGSGGAAYAGGITTPVMQVSVWDEAGFDQGSWNADSNGTLLDRVIVTGNTPLDPQKSELLISNWSSHIAGLDVSGATGPNVILEFDLIDGGYGAIDNLVVASSDTPGDVGGNEAPELTVSAATVTVNEGQVAINGILVSDPDDDTVTLTASVGQITEGGRLNGALNFDGGNDYAEAPSDPAFDTVNYTAEAWVKPDGSGASYKWIMGRRTSGSGWNVYISPAGNFQLWNGWSIPIQGPQASFGEWTHVAVTGDASGQELYINGQLAGSTAAVVNPAVNQTFILGANNDGKQWKFGGLMDDVRFWNVTRSESDIQNSMDSELAGNEAGLVAYYKLNDGPGNSTYADSTGDGHTGTLINMDPVTSWSRPGWSFDTTDGPVESQTVTITATDSNGASTQTTFDLIVNNVAPDFEVGGNATLQPEDDGVLNRGPISFTDPGADVWSGTVNWGDGSEPLVINQASKSFNLDHVYTSDGTYTVSVTVNDDDGGSHSDSFDVTVILNEPPVITANATTITVNEGDIATLGGSVSDPDGDTVGLSATSGSVTNNNDGTWSWSLATDDGPADGTGVTITGDDGNGATDNASFTVIVNNVAPDADVSGPASALVGESVTITLGATDVSTADQNAGFDFAIDWDGDGTVDETVSGLDGTTVTNTFGAGGSTTIIVTATDKDGGTSSQVSHTIELIQPVDIDVKPGNAKNKVNAKSQGVIPVAIYTTDDFDATTIVGSSVQLAGINADHFALEDVDGDGDLDMILHFDTQAVIGALEIDLDSGESVTVDAELTGQTIDNVFIQGFDTIEFFQPGRGKGRK